MVTWLLVQRGQAISRQLPPPPGTETAIFAQIEAPAVASLLLIIVALVWGTGFGTAAAAFAVGAKRPRLALLLGVVSLIWVIPTFLLAILAQDLQFQIYNLWQVNVTGGYATFSAGQLAWSAAVLAIRPAAYAYRQSSILIADQSRQLFVRTALFQGSAAEHGRAPAHRPPSRGRPSPDGGLARSVSCSGRCLWSSFSSATRASATCC